MTGVGGALLWAARQPWAPTDWSAVPAWQAWRREVEAGRRDHETEDALQEAAWWEVHACIAAHCNLPAVEDVTGPVTPAESYLWHAHDVVREGIAEHERLRAAG